MNSSLLILIVGFIAFGAVNLEAQAPSSIAGQAVIFSVQSSSGSYFAPAGSSYRFMSSAFSDDTYGVIGLSGTSDSYGTLNSYTHNGAVGTVTFTDSALKVPAVAVLTFLSNGTSGSFSITTPSVPGQSQSGTFSVYSGQAPSSVQGWTFQLQIDAGFNPYASSGSAQLIVANSGNGYQIIGVSPVSSSSGTYTYSNSSSSTSTSSVTLLDSSLGQEYTQTVSWNTSASGAYVIRNTSTGAFQAGTFTGTPPVTFTVMPSVDSNGAISPNTIQDVISGLSTTFTATPNNGYVVYQWLLNGVVAQIGGTSFTASNVTSNSTVQVTFQALASPTITSSLIARFVVGQLGNYIVTATGRPAPTLNVTSLPSWASFNPTTGVISGTPPDASDSPFTINLTAANGNSPDATAVLTLTVQPSANFSSWETSNNFTGPATTVGLSEAPENDGVPNLLKYFFGINPNGHISASDHAALPVVGTATIADTPVLTLTYRENPTQTGVTIHVQTSANLQTWTTVDSPTIVPTSTDPGTGDPIMQAQVPFSGTRQFIRLNVSSP